MIEVAAAMIENEQGQLLIARRGKGKAQAGLWEFPGGKVEAGETAQACLVRELREEMGIEIAPHEQFGVNEHDYGTFCIKLIVFLAKYLYGEIRLVDHDEYRWVHREELREYRWAPADVPFVEQFMARR